MFFFGMKPTRGCTSWPALRYMCSLCVCCMRRYFWRQEYHTSYGRPGTYLYRLPGVASAVCIFYNGKTVEPRLRSCPTHHIRCEKGFQRPVGRSAPVGIGGLGIGKASREEIQVQSKLGHDLLLPRGRSDL
eukprot:COSAG02_NODE_9821_length_2100_cov_1.967516_3_plen_131_part_00